MQAWDAGGDPAGEFPPTPRPPDVDLWTSRMFTAWQEVRTVGVTPRGVKEWCEVRGVRSTDTIQTYYDVLSGAEMTWRRMSASATVGPAQE